MYKPVYLDGKVNGFLLLCQPQLGAKGQMSMIHLDSRNCFLASGNVRPSFTLSS